MITVFSGGVGGARFLQGLLQVVDPAEVTVIANTGDDAEFFGVYVSPDIDIVLYHLAGLSDEERGWGLRGDSFGTIDALSRYGYEKWFRLGDGDFATCLHRANLLRSGLTLSQATADIAGALGVGCAVLPMSDQPVRTKLETPDGVLDFQEYFVKHRTEVPIRGIQFAGSESAAPAPGVIDAIIWAQAIIIAPSNPLVSVGPILMVPGVREALRETVAPIAAVSPIVGGATIKGPADRMLRELGHQASPAGVAALYRDFLDVLVMDQVDAALASEVDALGVRAVVTDTIMSSPEKKADLARTVLGALNERR